MTLLNKVWKKNIWIKYCPELTGCIFDEFDTYNVKYYQTNETQSFKPNPMDLKKIQTESEFIHQTIQFYRSPN